MDNKTHFSNSLLDWLYSDGSTNMSHNMAYQKYNQDKNLTFCISL